MEHNGRQCQKQIGALSALKSNQPDADRSYDFIARAEANKMLQQERLKNEREIRQMKIKLKRQHQELLENDSEALNIQLSNEDDSDLSDLDVDIFEDVEIDDTNSNSSPFSPPFSTEINEEQFKQNHERSHNNAECRTLEIALQQIHEDNQDLKNEFNDQRNRYQSGIDETRRMICDMRDRYDCIHHELEAESTYFERAKAELEVVIDRKRSQTRELEQQLLLARREQQILEQAAIEAQHRQQEMQELQEREELELQRQEEKLKREQQQIQQEQEEHDRQIQQELMQLAREEQERKQQLEQEEQESQGQQELMQLARQEKEQKQKQDQQEQAERLRHEELLRNHRELAELEKHHKEFDDIYFQLQEEEGSVNTGQVHYQYEHFGNSVPSMHSTQSTHFAQYDVARQQQQQQQQQYQQLYQQQQQYRHWQWQQSSNVEVPSRKSNSEQSKSPRPYERDPRQEIRTNSRSHGTFMNFNDMLV